MFRKGSMQNLSAIFILFWYQKKLWLTPDFKNRTRNLDNFRQKMESRKSRDLMGYLCQKCIPSTKTYTEDLSNITFNYFCENSPNSLSHFWNHRSFLMTQLLCIFLAQILHILDKSSPSKCNFQTFCSSRYNSPNSTSCFKWKVSFSSKFGWLFVIPRDNSFVLFSWNFICYWQKEPIKVQVLRFSTAPMKRNQTRYAIFQTNSHFFFKYCITFQCHDTTLLCNFFNSSQVHPVSHVIYETTSHFSFKGHNIIMYNSSVVFSSNSI